MEVKPLKDSEKQRLLLEIFKKVIFKPLFIAFSFSFSYGIFLFMDTNLVEKNQAFLTIFIVSFFIAFFYYTIGSGYLIYDMIIDYRSDKKSLGSFYVICKKEKNKRYYLETTDLNLPRIKADKKLFEKIPLEQQIELIVSNSHRVYRYNPLIENFRVDKLI